MRKSKSIILTEGSILKALTKLAMPIIGTSFVQMAYGFIDMIWVGRLGSGAVAAVGTVGFFTWLANAFIVIPRIGAEVGVAQSLGRKDPDGVARAIRHSLQLIIALILMYGSAVIVFRESLLGFYQLGEEIQGMANNYLLIIALGMVFFATNPIFTGVFNGSGDSTTPFRINTVGLLVNIVLDPLLIFGLGPFPALGVSGAAIATVIAQMTASVLFVLEARKRPELFRDLRFFTRPDQAYLKKMIKMGLPMSLQSALFTLISMTIARIISDWGPTAIAVQRVGSQIEQISWLTAGGFQSAMSAFTGQNYGAKLGQRVYRGYYVGLGIVAAIGVFATAVLILGAEHLFGVFIPEPDVIRLGASYLKIIGVSQLPQAVEILTAGAFIGLGKTAPPSIVGISLNLLRIPAALVLSATVLGLDGVWWAISISSILKGIILSTWYLRFMNTNAEMLQLRGENVA
ncbi:MAG TPA: MATE family efflux transporter [Firmicutes bacterium]|jgi:putative MATE family efflux protein|nr:MATE family efflux transporter [Bacillota bacterium]